MFNDPPNRRQSRNSSTSVQTDDAATGRREYSKSKGGGADPVDSRIKESHIASELKYLRDPVKLAEHVAYTLKQDDEEKALALTRVSSRALSNVVSWNHVIDWQMKKGKTRAAFETYNEMKKRNVRPDSYTYMLLLRGLGNHAHHPQSLGRALSLYHSISAPGNPVAPTIMHTNAVLKVCARANDMDSLWDIASRLPERGPHAADNMTFTTIINNLRLNALTGGPAEEKPEETARRHENAIVQGRRIWDMVIKRWRAGDLRMDEDLTCAIGRLLLVGGRPRDWDDILSLVQQTMNVPRLVPRLGSAGRHESQVSGIKAPLSVVDPVVNASDSKQPPDLPPSAEYNVDVFGPAKDSTGPNQLLNTRSASNRTSLSVPTTVAKPGPSTLSLILESCHKVAAKDPALAYWSLLTNPTARYAIPPDLDNMHMHLRILLQARASSAALALLHEDFPAAGIKPARKSFHLAMATCVRDAKNPHINDTAGKILDMALNSLAEPGALTLRLYLDVVELVPNMDVRASLRALERLEPGIVNLKSLLSFGSQAEAEQATAERQGSVRARSNFERAAAGREKTRDREEAVELMKRMVGAYDRIIDLSRGREGQNGYLSRDAMRLCQERKAKLSAFVQRQVLKESARGEGRKAWKSKKASTVPEEGHGVNGDHEDMSRRSQDYRSTRSTHTRAETKPKMRRERDDTRVPREVRREKEQWPWEEAGSEKREMAEAGA